MLSGTLRVCNGVAVLLLDIMKRGYVICQSTRQGDWAKEHEQVVGGICSSRYQGNGDVIVSVRMRQLRENWRWGVYLEHQDFRG